MSNAGRKVASRRTFLRSAAAGAALIAAPMPCPSRGDSPKPARLDKASVARTLADHRVAKIEALHVQDRFPRSIGPNGKGNPAGGGGGYQVRIVTTDQGATGWAMALLRPRFARRRLRRLGVQLDAPENDRRQHKGAKSLPDLVPFLTSLPLIRDTTLLGAMKGYEEVTVAQRGRLRASQGT